MHTCIHMYIYNVATGRSIEVMAVACIACDGKGTCVWLKQAGMLAMHGIIPCITHIQHFIVLIT